MPLTEKILKRLLNKYTKVGGAYYLKTTKRGGLDTVTEDNSESIINHTIKDHIHIGLGTASDGEWILPAGTVVNTPLFRTRFATFNEQILRYIRDNKSYQGLLPIQDDQERPHHYNLKIPFSQSEYNTVLDTHPLYKTIIMHRPNETERLTHIAINIDNNEVTSIMPVFSQLPHPPLGFMGAH